jgi:hypothetical protein
MEVRCLLALAQSTMVCSDDLFVRCYLSYANREALRIHCLKERGSTRALGTIMGSIIYGHSAITL